MKDVAEFPRSRRRGSDTCQWGFGGREGAVAGTGAEYIACVEGTEDHSAALVEKVDVVHVR